MLVGLAQLRGTNVARANLGDLRLAKIDSALENRVVRPKLPCGGRDLKGVLPCNICRDGG